MLRSLVSIRIQVYFTPRQGCFSPFPLGTLRYRSSDIFSLGPWSARIQPEFLVLRPTQGPRSDRLNPFAYGALTLSGWLSQHHSTRLELGNCPRALQCPPARPYYTGMRNACRLTRIRFRLLPVRSPLLRVSLRFLLYPATEMFHFADFAPALRVPGLRQGGYPIRTPPDQRSLASPRSISPLAASFFAVRYLGILRMPLFLYSPIHLCLLFSCQYTQGNHNSTSMVEMIGFEPTTHGLQSHCSPTELHPLELNMVGRGGFEPPTSRLSAACSNQLSYRPTKNTAHKYRQS